MQAEFIAQGIFSALYGRQTEVSAGSARVHAMINCCVLAPYLVNAYKTARRSARPGFISLCLQAASERLTISSAHSGIPV